jgi:hypothetical protein
VGATKGTKAESNMQNFSWMLLEQVRGGYLYSTGRYGRQPNLLIGGNWAQAFVQLD